MPGELSHDALTRAADSVRAVRTGHEGRFTAAPQATNQRLYSDENPLRGSEFAVRAALLSEIDAYARARDPRVTQVMASMYGEWQAVQILRADGSRVADLRPLVRLNVSVVVEQNGRRETGGHGTGGRFSYSHVMDPTVWRGAADEALRQALLNLDSVAAPAGEMEVVLGVRLARHPSARGDRPWPGGRLQSEEDLGFFRPARPADREPRRDGRG